MQKPSETFSRLNNWWSLPPVEQYFVVKMLFRLPAVAMALRIRHLESVLRWAHYPHTSANTRKPEDMALMCRYAELTRTVARYCLPGASCLPQSLALCRTLRQMGVNASVNIGVQKENAPLVAHAWVEVQGEPLDSDASLYTPLLSTAICQTRLLARSPADGFQTAHSSSTAP